MNWLFFATPLVKNYSRVASINAKALVIYAIWELSIRDVRVSNGKGYCQYRGHKRQEKLTSVESLCIELSGQSDRNISGQLHVRKLLFLLQFRDMTSARSQ